MSNEALKLPATRYNGARGKPLQSTFFDMHVRKRKYEFWDESLPPNAGKCLLEERAHAFMHVTIPDNHELPRIDLRRKIENRNETDHLRLFPPPFADASCAFLFLPSFCQ